MNWQYPSLDVDDGILRAWWIDPMIASLSFAFFVMFYWYHERKRGLSRDATFLQGCGYGQSLESLAAYWIGVYLFKCIIPSPATATELFSDGIPCSASSFLYLLAEVSSGIVLYDAIMFLLHWAMHELPLLRSFHARHHNGATLEARDTLRHSLVDGSLQVLVNICVQRRTPWGTVKSRLARALHNVLVTWMLTESHTSSPEPYIWRQWCVGVREHRLHHLSTTRSMPSNDGGRPHGTPHRHEQFFGYLDEARAAWWRQQRRERQEGVSD